MSENALQSTGVPFIDEMLGGGVEPGTLVVVHGATGVGKTQLGLSFLNAGAREEGQRGIIVDLATRGDSQQHAEYAQPTAEANECSGEVLPGGSTGVSRPVGRRNSDAK